MAINFITFAGESSLDHNVYVSGDETFNSPAKDYEKVSIPGRNGDLLVSKNRYKNVTVKYKAIILPGENWSEVAADVRQWLLKEDGYVRLEDTYNPNEYRVGVFEGPIDFTVHFLEAGESTLSFNCKPQRYLKIGDEEHPIKLTKTDTATIAQQYPDGFSIMNPTMFEASPRMIIAGTGKVKITNGPYTNEITIGQTLGTSPVIVDSELLTCYDDEHKNRNFDCKIGDFPTFMAGESKLTCDDTITSITIIPRWWRV